MINLARNPFVNPFVNPFMAVPNFGGVSPFASQIGGVNPLASPLGGISPFTSQMGGVQHPLFASQMAGISPLTSQIGGGAISPFAAQTGWGNPLTSQIGGVGANLPLGYGATGQFGTQFKPMLTGIGQSKFNTLAGGLGHSLAGINPLVAQALTNPAILSDPTVQALISQQLPIRPLTSGMQGFGSQQHIPGLTPQITGQQWVDPYTAFVQAQLYAQLVNHPLFQLSRGFGGTEAGGFGAPFAGQQFQTPLANYPFGV
jgi:hypothetical protein